MYYSVWSRARLTLVHEELLRLRGSSPYDEKWFERPNLDDRITTRLNVGDYFWARSGALRAHKTQVDENEPFWFGLNDAELPNGFGEFLERTLLKLGSGLLGVGLYLTQGHLKNAGYDVARAGVLRRHGGVVVE
jgi:hypothetical protein